VVEDQRVNFVEVESGATKATVTFQALVEHVAWSPSGVYAVIADKLGGLNFVLKGGKLLFRQPLIQVASQEPGTGQVVCTSFSTNF
jgi:hypothetical protein